MPTVFDNSSGQTLVGTIIAHAIEPLAPEDIPAGFLVCNGNPVSRATYAALFTIVGSQFGDGTKNANGSSSGHTGTHFNVPDLRGRFIRGWDNGATHDPDSATRTASNDGGVTGDHVGSLQSDDFKSHTHGLNVDVQGSNGGHIAGSDNASVQAGITTNATGGNETRPKNVNLIYLIKY